MVGIFNILEREQMKDNNAVAQLKELDIRLGKGVGAIKERAKLQKLIGSSKSSDNSDSNKQKKDPSKDHNLKGKQSKDQEKEGK